MSPQFLVTDIEHSIEFYTKQLGFEVEFRYEDFYAGIIKDNYSIHLKSGKPSIEERKSKRESKSKSKSKNFLFVLTFCMGKNVHYENVAK